jgi:hypothetical protein
MTIIGSIFILLIALYFARKFRDPDFDIEKYEYLKLNPESELLSVHISISYPESSIWSGGVENEGIVKISSTASWQTLDIHTTGPLPIKRDSIQLLNRPYKPTKCFHSEVLRVKVSNEYTASPEVLEFCEANNIGIEAGSWGAILIKEKGIFKASEIKNIISLAEAALRA